MRKLHLCVVLLSVFTFSSALFADQVVLKNGDRLTGTILKSDDKTLLIKTEFAGDVTVQWPAVQEVTSTQPLHVALSNGKTVSGPVTTTDGSLAVTTSASGTVTVAKADVTALRSDTEQVAYEKSLHPGLTQGWVGGANIGFALTAGNSETKSLAVAFTGDRKTRTDEIALYENTVYATNNSPGTAPSTSADSNQGGARYSRNLNPRLFAFVGADFQTNALQDLNLRSIFGGGLGFHAIKTDRTTLDFLAGPNYTREIYSTVTNSFLALTLGEELTQKVGATTVVTQKLYFFPDLSSGLVGQYHAAFNLGTVTKISKWLAWQNAFSDIYVTNPPAQPAGTLPLKTNDIILTTGLNFSFTH
jgi:putative salt-induced outer membrane protein YdiY